MFNWLPKLGGDPSEREIKRLDRSSSKINALEPTTRRCPTRSCAKDGRVPRPLVLTARRSTTCCPKHSPPSVRRAAHIGKRHYDVQLLGWRCPALGRIAEMKTGEGKTLVATLPLYLNALAGKGAHLVTPNDYLSRLGGGWMGPIYHALGLSVGVIAHEFAGMYDPEYTDPLQHPDERLNHWRPVPRREAYAADITYGTNNEFGFDYLRDNMVWELDRRSAARAALRHRRRSRQHPGRRGAHAADHLGPGRGSQSAVRGFSRRGEEPGLGAQTPRR